MDTNIPPLYAFATPDWYFDESHLKNNTPSILNGMNYHTECRYRVRGIKLIKDIATRLNLGDIIVATAALFFHRFYLFRGFQQFPEYRTASSCVFLACKLEDTPQLSNIIKRQLKALLTEEVYDYNFGINIKVEFYIMERVLLHTLKMDIVVDHPYEYIITYAKHLKDRTNDANLRVTVAQVAWCFITNSLYTTLCIQYEPEVLAIGALYLSAKVLRYDVVDWDDRLPHHRVWWDLFVEDLSIITLEGSRFVGKLKTIKTISRAYFIEISNQINDSYQQERDLHREATYCEILEPDVFNLPTKLAVIRLISSSPTPNSLNRVLSSSDCPVISFSDDTVDENNPPCLNVYADPADRPDSYSSVDYPSSPPKNNTDTSGLQTNTNKSVNNVVNVPQRLETLEHESCGCYDSYVWNPFENYFDYDDDNDRDNKLHLENLIPYKQRCKYHEVQNWLDTGCTLNVANDNSNIQNASTSNNENITNNSNAISLRENTLPDPGQGPSNVKQNHEKNNQQKRKPNRKRNRKQNRKQKRKQNRKQINLQNCKQNRKRNRKQNNEKNRKRNGKRK